jgi:eukaryotic-like serine/threonine-protein kinase
MQNLMGNVPNISEIQKLFPKVSNISYINKGGFKYVYRCEINGNTEALKLALVPKNELSILSDNIDKKNELVKRITREIKILEKCKCPYIVKLGNIEPHEVEISNNTFIAYSEEFINGNNLFDLIQKKCNPNEEDLKKLAYCLFKSIKEMWFDLKIIHRDIKPLNIIKTNDCKRPFVLLDFGIAYSLYETPLTINQSNRFPPGTFHYLAPEMFNPNFRETLDFRSDLYTTGLTIFEFAAGRNPLIQNGDDLFITVGKILNENPILLQNVRKDLSLDFCNIINQLLKKLPALRPSNLDLLTLKMEQQ